MLIQSKNKTAITVISILMVANSCDYDYFPPPVKPKKAKETSTLEATYSTEDPEKVTSSYWKTADYLKVKLSDVSTKSLYDDGMLNMTGSYNGSSDFNGGKSVDMTMRAAYSDDRLYVLLEWADNSINPSRASWLFNGPSDSRKPNESTDGWTSQRNGDAVALAFEIESAKAGSNTFSSAGCNASCHNGQMKPESGKVDIWNWSLALSEPIGYAADMYASGDSNLRVDGGQPSYRRNTTGNTARSGPMYEFDGTSQSVVRPDGVTALLDAAYYLYNKTPFVGDPTAGMVYFHDSLGAHCYKCHGKYGTGGGPDGDGPAFTNPHFNRFSKQSFTEAASATSHDGRNGFTHLSEDEQTDLIAYIRGLSGVPGYYLQEPTASCADISVNSSVTLVKIEVKDEYKSYKVLLVRNLKTNNDDDVQFDPSTQDTYPFGLALMNNDGRNHIGSVLETLTFLSK